VIIPELVSKNIIEAPIDFEASFRAFIEMKCALDGVDTSLMDEK
jgi:hypothetical protein